jgi:predicted sugar kinase
MPTLNTETAKGKRAERKERLLEVENDAHLDIVIMSWFGPTYSRLTSPKRDARKEAEARDLRKAEIRARVDAVKATAQERMAKIVLLNMVLPHGKAVKDSTGRECAQLGPKVGEWLSRVAGELRPNQVVGKVLSEDRLQELYAA